MAGRPTGQVPEGRLAAVNVLAARAANPRIMVDGGVGCRSPAQRLAGVALLSAGPHAGPFPQIADPWRLLQLAAGRRLAAVAAVQPELALQFGDAWPATPLSASVARRCNPCNAAMTGSEDAGPAGTGAASSCESKSVGRDIESLTHALSRKSSLDRPRATWAVTTFRTHSGHRVAPSGLPCREKLAKRTRDRTGS